MQRARNQSSSTLSTKQSLHHNKLTKRDLFPSIWWQSKGEYTQHSEQHTGSYDVEEIIESSSPDTDRESQIDKRILRTAQICDDIPLCWKLCNMKHKLS